MISLRARLIRYLTRLYFKRVTPDRAPAALRRSFEDLARRLPPLRGVRQRAATVAGVDCEWLLPGGCTRAPVLLYLHGGAYVMGSSRTHRRLAGYLARGAGVRALLPNYRLAPEHPFPAALEDVCAVYRALLDQGVPAGQILLGGDSAGGGLAVSMLLALRDAGTARPAAAVLLSPWLDLSGSGESLQTRAALDPLFRPAEMPAAAAFYCRADQLREPLVSPVFANVHDLPPLFVQLGDHEILLSDATRFTDKVSRAGGTVTLQIWPGMWHVFQFFAGLMPESSRAVADICRFMQHRLAENGEAATD